ncbi:RHS repeat-associated core domain-containing protein, partial [bacterium]|nr:RHS repeat-associated core domain-containing protein [bacterium]
VNARYNGNIAQMAWITAGSPGAYNFTYDKANRLTDAVSVSPVTFSLQNQTLSGTYTNSTGDSTYLKDITISAGSNVTIQSHTSMRIQAGFTSNGSTVSLKPGVISAGTGGGYGDYSEKAITYDANGNIKTLTRSTAAAMVYAYDASKPNRLNSVSGGLVQSYTYDNNGNMLRDGKNKIGYDYRNMPITDTLLNGKIIRFAYDAGGQRIKYLRYSGATLLDSSKIFVLNGGKIVAEYIRLSGAWQVEHYNIYGNELVGKLNSANQRYYNLTDHLGSVRVTLKEDGSIDSWSDYYPFGKEARGSSTVNEPKEQFTGKERDYESGLDYFGARYYNSEVGRWMSVDPKSAKGPQYSPYLYTFDNPILMVDPNGKWPTEIHNTIIQRAFASSLSSQELKVLQNASYYADHKPGAQGSGSANEHSMSQPGQKKADAEKNTKEFIESKIDEFVNKDGDEALFALGEAMHAVMDGTSPTHSGYQEWSLGGKDVASTIIGVGMHLLGEENLLGESNKEIDEAVSQAQMLWERATQKKNQKKKEDEKKKARDEGEEDNER